MPVQTISFMEMMHITIQWDQQGCLSSRSTDCTVDSGRSTASKRLSFLKMTAVAVVPVHCFCFARKVSSITTSDYQVKQD